MPALFRCNAKKQRNGTFACSSSGFDFYRKLIQLHRNQFLSTFRISKQN